MPNKSKTSAPAASAGLTALVWVIRIVVGATFVFSGFSKAVDPWGTMYKITEYFDAWNMAGWFSKETVFFMAALLALTEFCAGALVMLGCMRRVGVWILLAMMAVMLPLTAYIMIANPVADCGCFGDAWVISNTATFVKNIIITALIVVLVIYNYRVTGIIPPLLQWIALVACVIYCIVLSLIGYMIQPVVDFRPYKVGTPLVSEEDYEDASIVFVFEKDGVKEEFTTDNLPDSTWQFVERKENSVSDVHSKQLAIFDGDEDVTDIVIPEEGDFVILAVSNPDYHSRARSSMANRINQYVQRRGGDMIALVPLSGNGLKQWEKLANPDYEVYTAEDTSIKELARGDAAIVYLKDGIIKWKRNLYSLPGDFPSDIDSPDALQNVRVVDSGTYVLNLTLVLLAVLILLIMIGSGRLVWLQTHAQKMKSRVQKSVKNKTES